MRQIGCSLWLRHMRRLRERRLNSGTLVSRKDGLALIDRSFFALIYRSPNFAAFAASAGEAALRADYSGMFGFGFDSSQTTFCSDW